MCRFTLDIIGTCAFGLEFNALSDPESQYRKISKRVFQPTFKAIMMNLIRFVSPNLLKSLNISEIPAEVESFFYDLLKRTEEHRKTEKNRRNDLMQLMLDIKEREMNDLTIRNDENNGTFV